MLVNLRRLYNDNNGVAAVEFCFIGAIFLTVILSALEFVLIMIVGNQLESAVEKAARLGLTGRDYVIYGCQGEECMATIFEATAPQFIDIDKLDTSVSNILSDIGGDIVTYQATYTWDYYFPLLRPILGENMVLTSQTVQKHENY